MLEEIWRNYLYSPQKPSKFLVRIQDEDILMKLQDALRKKGYDEEFVVSTVGNAIVCEMTIKTNSTFTE